MRRQTLFAVLLVFTLASPSFAAAPFFDKERKVTLAASREFPELGKNFSGAVYYPENGRYLVLDDSCKIIEISYSEEWIEAVGSIKIKGLKDCEDIAVLTDGSVAVTEERKGNIVFFDLPVKNILDCKKNCEVFHVEKMKSLTRPNTGLEALTASGPVLYAGKEEFPRKIYRLTSQNKSYKVTVPWNAEKSLPEGSDISGMVYFENSLFILDERGETVRQVEPSSGKILSSYVLPKFSVFSHQYEGIAMVRRGKSVEMLIAAEKNEIQVYRIEETD